MNHRYILTLRLSNIKIINISNFQLLWLLKERLEMIFTHTKKYNKKPRPFAFSLHPSFPSSSFFPSFLYFSININK